MSGATPLRPPRTLGRYDLVGRLGSGGMGTVFIALQRAGLAGDRLCVVKTIKRMNASLDERFLDEARTSLQLRHRNICVTYDVILEEGTTAIAMELIAGCDCKKVWKTGPVPAEIVAAIGCFVIDGLSYAHGLKDPRTGNALHVVHRDLSPHNVMISFDGEVKVIDFGVATSDLKTSETAVGSFVGKLRYAAPEQIIGGIGASTDLYALAIVLAELASGERFYGEGTNDELVVMVLGSDVPFSSPCLARVPAPLRTVLESVLARDPSDRASASDVRRALVRIAGGEPGAEAVRAFIAERFPGAAAEHDRQIRALLADDDEGPSTEPAERPAAVSSSTDPGDPGDHGPEAAHDPSATVVTIEAEVFDDGTGRPARVSSPADAPTRVSSSAPSPHAATRVSSSANAPTVISSRSQRASTTDPKLDDDTAAPATASAPVDDPLALAQTRVERRPPGLAVPEPTAAAPRIHRTAAALVIVAAAVALGAWAFTHRDGASASPSVDAGAAALVDAGHALALAVDAGALVVDEVDAGEAATVAVDAGALVVDAGDVVEEVDVVDAGATSSKRNPRIKRPKEAPLPPRPRLTGQQLRYLQEHCGRRAATCTRSLAAEGGKLAGKAPQELRAFAAAVDACLDRCGAPPP